MESSTLSPSTIIIANMPSNNYSSSSSSSSTLVATLPQRDHRLSTPTLGVRTLPPCRRDLEVGDTIITNFEEAREMNLVNLVPKLFLKCAESWPPPPLGCPK